MPRNSSKTRLPPPIREEDDMQSSNLSPTDDDDDDDENDDDATLQQTNLVHAEIANSVDVEALVNERFQRLVAGTITTAEVHRVEENDDESEEDEDGCLAKARNNIPLITLMGVVVITGVVVAAVVSSHKKVPPPFLTAPPTPNPSSPSPTTQSPTTLSPTQDDPRYVEITAVLKDFVPWHLDAFYWLVDTDTWEPDDEGDPNIRDYLWIERYVMAELYYTTNGPNWHKRANWLSSEPVCKWFLNGASNGCPGPIKELTIVGNQLTSSIPSSIGSLTQLTLLSFSFNALTSSLPSEIGSLTQLTFLDLDSNQLTKSLPSEIGSLTQLKILNLYNNQWTSSIPSSIGSLTQLSWVSFAENNLSGTIPLLPASVERCFLGNNCFQETSNGQTAGCDVVPNCA